MSSQDLTNLTALKNWLGLPPNSTVNDFTFAAVVTAASRAIYALLSRPALLPASYTEVLDSERRRIFLRNWPVLSVESVILDGIPIPPAPFPGTGIPFGYLLQPGDIAPPGAPQALDIFGFCVFPQRQSLVVTYRAGYAVQNEAATIPSGSPFTVSALEPYGPWASDLGVTYASTGLPLTAVQTAPAQGQYSVLGGVYTFSASDAGAAVLISYGFVPQDLAQAALELSAERFRASDHIGLRTKSIGGQETIAYDLSAISAPILSMLQPYRRVSI